VIHVKTLFLIDYLSGAVFTKLLSTYTPNNSKMHVNSLTTTSCSSLPHLTPRLKFCQPHAVSGDFLWWSGNTCAIASRFGIFSSRYTTSGCVKE
jgi:hypothetical protein